MPNEVPAPIDATEVIALRAPSVASDTRIPQFLILAESLLGDKIPEGMYREYSKALQVLHWIEMSGRANDGDDGAGVGSITMEKEGELTIKYGNTSTNVMYFTSDMKAELSQTIWGMELYTFIKKVITPFGTRFSF